MKLEQAVKRAHDGVNEAIELINESKTPTLNKVDPKIIKDKSHLLEYYIPENEELNEYLVKFNRKFTSKRDDLLEINGPHDLDKAVEVLDYD